MMRSAILNFPEQFAFEPIVENAAKLGFAADGQREDAGKLGRYNAFVVAGMGGSHWAADILKGVKPDIEMLIHSDYGLPFVRNPERTLFIASSYSGNTEEPIDALHAALAQGMPTAAIAVGGHLLEIAKKEGMPYVPLPDTNIQPRCALGFSLRALLSLMGERDMLSETTALAGVLDPKARESEGRTLATALAGRVPVIYASERNRAVALNWKIKLNETGKIPAFANVIPELNHNEMNGFDVTDATRTLAAPFHFIFLKDDADDPRVVRRMDILERMYNDRGLAVMVLTLAGKSALEKIFSSLILADWTALATAEHYGNESEQVPMVEQFKKLMQ